MYVMRSVSHKRLAALFSKSCRLNRYEAVLFRIAGPPDGMSIKKTGAKPSSKAHSLRLKNTVLTSGWGKSPSVPE